MPDIHSERLLEKVEDHPLGSCHMTSVRDWSLITGSGGYKTGGGGGQ